MSPPGSPVSPSPAYTDVTPPKRSSMTSDTTLEDLDTMLDVQTKELAQPAPVPTFSTSTIYPELFSPPAPPGNHSTLAVMSHSDESW